MGGLLDMHEGQLAVAGARHALAEALASREPAPVGGAGVFGEMRGVFVSLHTHPAHSLRGCIGFPYPSMPLGRAISQAAIAAGIEDFRFAPVQISELSKIVFEVSVLTPPEEIKASSPDMRKKAVKIGRDGLILQYGGASGLLLPQVPIEWNWNEAEFLQALCEKAGLPRDMYKSPSARLFSFQAQIFEEQEPNGKAILKKLVK